MRIEAGALLGVQKTAQAPGGAVQEEALVVVWAEGSTATAATAAAAAAATQRLEHAGQQGEQRLHLADLLVVHDRAQLQAHKVQQRAHVLVEAGAQRRRLALPRGG